MLPFDQYPGRGRELLEFMTNSNCYDGYGAAFLRRTKQQVCAYCGMDLWTNYDGWKSMTLDHVVLQKACDDLNIPLRWCHDFSNAVLACMACNSFDNRFWHFYKPFTVGRTFDTLEKFWDLRDEIFPIRKKRVAARIQEHCHFYLTLNPSGRLPILLEDSARGKHQAGL
jgi:hypothetical protein